jgi:WD40 repeat protein
MRASHLKLACIVGYLLCANHLSAQEPKLRITLKGHTDVVRCLAFSPDGATLVSCEEKSFTKWRLATGDSHTTKDPLKYECVSIAISPNGRSLFLGGYTTIKMLDQRFSRSVTYDDEQPCICLYRTMVISPNGKELASADRLFGGVQLWHVNVETFSLARSKPIETEGTLAMAFTPDSKTLACMSEADGLMLREVSSGRDLHDTLKSEERKQVEKLIAGLGDEDPDKRDQATKELKRLGRSSLALLRKARGDENDEISKRAMKIIDFLQASGPKAHVRHAAAFTADCKTLATAGSNNDIKLWEVSTGKEKSELPGSTSVFQLAFSPDGKTLAAGCEDGSIKLWNVTTGKELAKLDGHKGNVWSLAFSRDGKTLASGGEDGTVKIWDMVSGK